MAIVAVALLLGAVFAGMIPDFDLEGTDASEKYSGTPENDEFDGGGGNDLLIGHAGDDTLAGGDGDDWVIGQTGDDSLTGGNGDDVLIGGSGSDVLAAGAGNDFVESANVVDADLLQASLDSANTFAEIDFAYDLPNTSDESDVIHLGDGDDTAVIGSDDTLTSGEGADEISIGDWISAGAPATITDFDPSEDLLLFSHDQSTSAPELSLHYNTVSNNTELRADGAVIAMLENPVSDVSLQNIRVNAYA